MFLPRRHLFLVEIQPRGLTNIMAIYHELTQNRLSTLLDLKAENHRLQRKVMDYKNRVPIGSSTTSTLSSTSQANPMYATSSLHPTPRVLSTPCQNISDPSNSFDQVAVASGSNYSLDFAETLYGPNASNINLEEINLNEGSKKKKVSNRRHKLVIVFLNDNTLSQRRHRVRSSTFVSPVDAPILLNGER